MPTRRFLQYDVFSDTALAGNQLAVFPDGTGLDAGTMQRIALEMNFSETTFVFPPTMPGTDARVRIFTPARELPMAGHPTIGTTFALVREGRIAPGGERAVLELGIGPTPVTLEWRGAALAFAWMTQPRPTFGPPLPARDEVAAALGVEAADMAAPHLPVQVVSCGVPFVIAPLASPDAVDRAELDRARWRAVCQAQGLDEHMVFLFAMAPDAPGRVHSRMFAPVSGVPEDPGTGSASGPLGAYLVQYRRLGAGRRPALVRRAGKA